VWSQATPGVAGTPENRRRDESRYPDMFGSTLAVGDFDGNGFADLAVGVPGESLHDGAASRRGVYGAGAVNVLTGSARGLAATDQLWSQDSAGVPDRAENDMGELGPIGESFGAAVTAGDFNGDGRADLAVGVPKETLPGSSGCEGPCPHGAVNVLYGSRRGLTGRGSQYWPAHHFPGGMYGAGNEFGSALAAGDFNGDGVAELAIGAPYQGAGGSVEVLPGHRGHRLSAAGRRIWTQGSRGILAGRKRRTYSAPSSRLGPSAEENTRTSSSERPGRTRNAG